MQLYRYKFNRDIPYYSYFDDEFNKFLYENKILIDNIISIQKLNNNRYEIFVKE